MLPAVRDAYLATKNQMVLGTTKDETVRLSMMPQATKGGGDPPIPPAVLSMQLAAVVGLGYLAFLFMGCPVWEREACGAPRAYACQHDQPYVCSPSGHWTPIGDTPCSASGGVCAMVDGGIAACVAAQDGGAR